MAKIAVDLEIAVAERKRTGVPGRATRRTLAHGDGWSVEDILCTSGPDDQPFEEMHSAVSIAVVAAGTFQCRATTGRELMTPGSLLLGNAQEPYECGHQHGIGDRCIAFQFSPDYFLARVTRVVRMIEQHSEGPLTLSRLAKESGLSLYHFLRVFQQITGVTPHQYLLRMRLRTAALQLADAPHRVLDIALECGFGDISNFNRTFRAEFGLSPLAYRLLVRHRG